MCLRHDRSVNLAVILMNCGLKDSWDSGMKSALLDVVLNKEGTSD